ncbi:hypothetical protein [Candidatus Uabimicrobium amorphum]|uniref:Uncharacterized protein n=1 Tax=Uabimicrobium amorphum TaxID=2596890 RepID=A0A5S9IJG7_UABAM|nr:hypothetical protein [Candidatus Uabimicrobium amorphum]BBM83009.1 hypothetical protein UABAM_01352 [Candidatus Uabimicrobium amorphum]
MTRVYLVLLVLLSSLFADQLPKVHFSVKNFPQMDVWQEYLGDTSYITYEHDSSTETKAYNYSANMNKAMLPAIFNDDRSNFNGNFSSFSSTNNVRLLEALLAKGYHLQVYVHHADSAAEYTIVGYDRQQQQFTVRNGAQKEQKFAYDNFDIRYAQVKSESLQRTWHVSRIGDDAMVLQSAKVEASSIADALQKSNILQGRIFLQLVTDSTEDFPVHISGWGGETQFEQPIQFSGTSYGTLAERIVTIYISDQSATGCHMTRYTVGGKGDGYSESVISGEVYCNSQNPTAINKAAGLVQFALRCKVRKNAPKPWWVKAQIYYRLFTPDGK